jgi:hypothetical protein
LKKNLEEKKGVRDELKTLEKMAMHKVQDKNNTLEMYAKVLFMTDTFLCRLAQQFLTLVTIL